MSDQNDRPDLGNQQPTEPEIPGTPDDVAMRTEGATGSNLAEAAMQEAIQASNDVDQHEAAIEAERDAAEHESLARQILSSSWLMTILAIVIALVISSILICATDPDVQQTAGYFFARPGDFFSAVWDTISQTYTALFQGAIFNPDATSWARALKPLTETAVSATPLILAGLGLAVAFQAGVFNIGGQGQIIVGAIVASYIGFTFTSLPGWLLMTLGVLGGIVAGAIWGGIAGLLKAKTGAHEVITTIMLNWVAVNLLSYLLTSTDTFRIPGSNQAKSQAVAAPFPLIFGDMGSAQWRLNLAFIIALVAAVLVWVLMSKSTLGMRFRAVGANERAAKVAGMSVAWSMVGVMLIAGGLAGLAGAGQIFGSERNLTMGIAGTIGFDAITVALLGRSKPLGVVLAGLLFGALKAASPAMQAAGAKSEIVIILQAVIVLLIAAPPLVRTIFHLPAPRPKVLKSTKRQSQVKEVAA